MKTKNYHPIPVFDTLPEVVDQYKALYRQDNPRQQIQKWLTHCFSLSKNKVTIPSFAAKDYQLVLNFLYSYRGSSDTFDAYRRDLERLLQWSWFVREQPISKHKREDIEAFVEFCKKPYKRWIGLKKVARFKLINAQKIPNSQWHPFSVSISKKDRYAGVEPSKEQYQLSQQALKVMFGIMSSFYNYLLQEEITQANPVALIRQKSKFLRKEQPNSTIRRLSQKQWAMVIQLTTNERTMFILSCLYAMYLRISELVSKSRWTPTMGDFSKDHEGNWWFRTVGKGNKARQIAVSDAMLKALKHYRECYLQLPAYPLPDEKMPLIGHLKNPNLPITSDRPIRRLVQACFDKAADHIQANGDPHEAELLRVATVHWLRHTGISEDVKHRPREHVRDDAGHSSSAITDRYIDVELKERAKSAKQKSLLIKKNEDE